MFDNLSEGQRKALAVGAPVVAVFALVSAIQKRNQPVPTETKVTGALPANLAPTTDAIGVGQLSEFQSLVTNQISQLAGQVAKLPTEFPEFPDIPAPVIQQAPSPAAVALPNVRSDWYPVVAPQGEDMAILGSITGQGYQGFNVKGGAPVYAFVDGQWRQNFGEASKLPVGTPLATLDTFDPYIDRAKTA